MTGSLLVTLQYILGNSLVTKSRWGEDSFTMLHSCLQKQTWSKILLGESGKNKRVDWDLNTTVCRMCNVPLSDKHSGTWKTSVACTGPAHSSPYDGVTESFSTTELTRYSTPPFIRHFAFMMTDGIHDNTCYHSIMFLQTGENGIFDGAQVTRTSKYKISQLPLLHFFL